MTEKEQIKKDLEDQLEEVKHRIQILDLTQDRLLKMRKIAQSGVGGGLTEEEVKKANKQIKDLQEQIRLLSAERTQLS